MQTPQDDVTVYDDDLARRHLRYLGQAGLTAVLATPHRLADGLAWRLATGEVEPAPDAHRWVETPRALARFATARAALPGTPEAVRTLLQEAGPRLAFVDRFDRRHLAMPGAEDVTTLRALMVALAPAGEAPGDAEALTEALVAWCAEQGFAEPLIVEAGDGRDVYFALPPVAVTEAERERLSRRVRAFSHLVAERLAEPARAAAMRVLTGTDLHQSVLLWGTPAPQAPDRPVRLVRPREPEAPRREDAVLRRFLLDSPLLDREDPADTEAFAWPDGALDGLAPDEAALRSIAAKHPNASSFFAELDRQWARSHGRLEEFSFRVLAVIVGLYAIAAELPIEQAPRAIARNARALKKAYQAWAFVMAGRGEVLDEAWSGEGTWNGSGPSGPFGGLLGDRGRWFLHEGLSALDADPGQLAAFLRAEGLLAPGAVSRARVCPAPFAPKLVTWEARRAAQAAWMADRLAENRPGLFVNNAEPSVSKTAAALALMAAHPEKRFLYLAPSHALLQDVYRRALEAGIPASDMRIAEGLERTCTFPEAESTIFRDMRLGRDFKAAYCRPGGRCGRQASCLWHTQKADAKNARILLAPSAHLAREHHFGFLLASVWGNDSRDVIVIDEDPSGYLGLRRTLDPFRLAAMQEALAGLDGAASYADDMSALIDFVRAFAETPARERATYHGGSTPDDEWRAARKLARGRLRAIAEDADESDELPLLDALLADARSADGLTLHKDADGLPYTFRPTPALPEKPVFILDGTAVPAFYRQAFRRHGEPVFFLDETPAAERTYVAPAGRIVQIVDAGNSRTRLRQDAVVERLIRSVRGFVSGRRAADPARRTLLVTYMDQAGTPYESRFREGLADLGVEVTHFGAIRGLDGFAGWDTIVVGAHRLNPGAYADEARKTLGIEPMDMELVPATHMAPTRLPGSYETAVSRYRDPALQAVFEQKTLAEVVQAIARSRVLVPGHEGAMAVVYTNVPLPGLLVEPMSQADFDAALHGTVSPSAAPGGPTGPPEGPEGSEPLRVPLPDDKALRSALAKVIATVPSVDARQAREMLEGHLGRRLSPGILARLWAGPRPATPLMRDRARHRITQDLEAQGLTGVGEAYLLAELWADAAARLAGPFWIETTRGLLTLQGVGLNASAQAQVETLVERAQRMRAAGRAGSGPLATEGP
jgi:hypothetical protein